MDLSVYDFNIVMMFCALKVKRAMFNFKRHSTNSIKRTKAIL